MRQISVLILILFGIIQTIFAQLPPAPPTGVTFNQQELTNSVDLTWNAPLGTINGYKIYFYSVSDPLDSALVPATATGANISNLIYNEAYTFYLKSFRVSGADTIRSSSTGFLTLLVISLNTPTISIVGDRTTNNTIGLQIDDINQYETSFDIELTENGNITNLTNSPGSSIYKPLTGLKPKTTYTIRIRARNNNKVTLWSAPIYATTKVDFPPIPVIVSDLNCPDKVHIKWSVATRADEVQEYIVQKSYDNVTFERLSTLTSGVFDYYDLSVIPGSTHYYRVISSNTTGTTLSNILPVRPLTYQNPNPPVNPISDQGNKSRNHLTFRWTNGSEDLECRTNIRTENIVLVRINGIGDYKKYANLPPFASSIRIENLSPKDKVEVAIFALSDKGLVSSQAQVRDTTPGPPDAPTNPIAVLYRDVLGTAAFGLEWKHEAEDEDYFIIERSTNNINFIELGRIKNTVTSFNDLTPEEATIYYYRFKAASYLEGESPYSTTIGPFIVNPTKAPNAPYGLKAKENAGKVNLTWYDDSVREENYIIEKSLDAGVNYSLVATLGKNVTTYTDENVSAGKTYLYRAIAKNAVGSSANSNIANIKMSGVGITPNPISINIYPNPTFETLNIKSSEIQTDAVYNLRIFDRNNRQVLSRTIKLDNSEAVQIPVNRLNQGLYNVVITNGETSISKRIFKY